MVSPSSCWPVPCLLGAGSRLGGSTNLPAAGQALVPEELAGISHLLPEIMPPAWPCFHLKVLALITSGLDGTLQSPSVFETEITCTSTSW